MGLEPVISEDQWQPSFAPHRRRSDSTEYEEKFRNQYDPPALPERKFNGLAIEEIEEYEQLLQDFRTTVKPAMFTTTELFAESKKYDDNSLRSPFAPWVARPRSGDVSPRFGLATYESTSLDPMNDIGSNSRFFPEDDDVYESTTFRSWWMDLEDDRPAWPQIEAKTWSGGSVLVRNNTRSVGFRRAHQFDERVVTTTPSLFDQWYEAAYKRLLSTSTTTAT